MNTDVQKITPSLKMQVASLVQEVLQDPDFGLKLSVEAKKRLNSVREGKGKKISFSDIKRKYL